jgi:hypothetical protein
LFVNSAVAEAAMSRVVEVRDSRTIVVKTNEVVTVVKLRDVNVFPPEEGRATAYLRKTLDNRWVYNENGDVYRSPDALFINKALRQRAWLGVTFLGELYLSPSSDAAPRPRPTKQKRK